MKMQKKMAMMVPASQTCLVGGWTNPFEKYVRHIGSFPQISGWKYKIFELPPPSCSFVFTWQNFGLLLKVENSLVGDFFKNPYDQLKLVKGPKGNI